MIAIAKLSSVVCTPPPQQVQLGSRALGGVRKPRRNLITPRIEHALGYRP
jgi:hypothetical protein